MNKTENRLKYSLFFVLRSVYNFDNGANGRA